MAARVTLHCGYRRRQCSIQKAVGRAGEEATTRQRAQRNEVSGNEGLPGAFGGCGAERVRFSDDSFNLVSWSVQPHNLAVYAHHGVD
jgi:hypothetical protein